MVTSKQPSELTFYNEQGVGEPQGGYGNVENHPLFTPVPARAGNLYQLGPIPPDNRPYEGNDPPPEAFNEIFAGR